MAVKGLIYCPFQIMGITEEKNGRETFVAAAFPSACGKTNMAMLTPLISGYKVQCVGEYIRATVMPTESDSDVILCLQLLSKTQPCTLHLS